MSYIRVAYGVILACAMLYFGVLALLIILQEEKD
jgi:hypothetical protein